MENYSTISSRTGKFFVNVFDIFFKGNQMRELIKYLLLLAITILMTVGFIAEVLAQGQIKAVRNNFTGEKVRYAVELDRKSEYSIVEDWEDNRIDFIIKNVNPSDLNKYKTGKWQNYIVKNTNLKINDRNLVISLTTAGGFKYKTGFVSSTKTVYLDIFRDFAAPDVKTLTKRGKIYEERADYGKAAIQFKKALNLNPEDDYLRFKHGTNLYNGENYDESVEVLSEISRDSKYFTMASDLIKSMRPNPEESDDINIVSQIEDKPLALNTQSFQSKPLFEDAQKELKPNENKTADINLPESKENKTEALPVQPDKQENTDGNEESFLKFGSVLEKSGIQNYVLMVLYLFLGLLLAVVFYLTRKIIRLSRKKVKRSKKKETAVSLKEDAKPAINRKSNSFVDKEQLNEVKSFANKLSQMYSKTDNTKKIPPRREQRPAENPINNYRIQDDHNEKIEKVFKSGLERELVDSEAVKLINQFKEAGSNTNNSGDKVQAVKQLYEQDWEIWEIARELGMGSEEVKIALDVSNKENNLEKNTEVYEKIYRLADMKLTVPAISERLKVGEEVVNLALKLRQNEMAFI